MQSMTADTSLLTVKRTTTFLVSLVVALSCGTNYVYSVYGPQLGRRLQLSYAEQNLVGLGGNLGVYASGPFLGKLVDSTGPRPSLALAFLFLPSGYLGVKAVYDASEGGTEPVGDGTLFTLILFELLSGIGSDAGYTAVVNTIAKSFPDKIITTAMGFIVSGFGLSAFLFSAIARTFFPGDTSYFLLTLAAGTAVPMILGYFFIRPCPYPERIAETTIESNDQEQSDNTSSISSESSPLITKDNHMQPPSVTALAMMCTIDFWILFWITSFLTGTGIMWMNNVGLIARALLLKNNPSLDEEESVKWQTLQVSAMSIGSFFGRVLIGVTADIAKHRGMRRAQLIPVVATSFLLSQLVGLRVQHIEHLQYAALLVGMSYGETFALLTIVIIEWFGMAHVSENIGYFALSPLVMGNIFSMTFGRIFDAHSSRTEHGVRCFEGAGCYSESLYVTVFASFFALILACVAAKRDKKYR